MPPLYGKKCRYACRDSQRLISPPVLHAHRKRSSTILPDEPKETRHGPDRQCSVWAQCRKNALRKAEDFPNAESTLNGSKIGF